MKASIQQVIFPELDSYDHRILEALQRDCKLTVKELAQQVGLSATPVHERVKKLERSGVIRAYVALLDPGSIGLNLCAFCNVSLKQHSQEYLIRFEQEVLQFREVLECYHTAGGFDYLLKILVSDMGAYQDFLVNRLAAFEYIGKVQSSFVMTEVKHSTALCVPE